MAVKPCSLKLDMRRHEAVRHGTPMFPCSGYDTTVGDHLTECISWHWHEEVEVLIVTSGVLRLDVPSRTILVREGEGAFINSSVLQTLVNADESVCEINSLVFDPLLICGSFESAIAQKYVRPLANCPLLSAVHFQHTSSWHREAVLCIQNAFSHFKDEPFGYELAVREQLSKLWLLIASHHQEELMRHQSSKNTEAQRAKAMLAYLHAHYAEPVSLHSIASAASVSERECLRCFQLVLGCTPMQYLLRHRISVAAGLLISTDYNVTEICKLCGFESPSYFSLKFKALTKTTPSAYRQQNPVASHRQAI